MRDTQAQDRRDTHIQRERERERERERSVHLRGVGSHVNAVIVAHDAASEVGTESGS
jgi:hypothetical protein